MQIRMRRGRENTARERARRGREKERHGEERDKFTIIRGRDLQCVALARRRKRVLRFTDKRAYATASRDRIAPRARVWIGPCESRAVRAKHFDRRYYTQGGDDFHSARARIRRATFARRSRRRGRAKASQGESLRPVDVEIGTRRAMFPTSP